eukprot:7603681-Pyramimonas_sp.AAC.1
MSARARAELALLIWRASWLELAHWIGSGLFFIVVSHKEMSLPRESHVLFLARRLWPQSQCCVQPHRSVFS